jgi:Pentapeptide repeats (8 copies)
MAEPNPHQRIARLIAFACYLLAGLVLVVGVFFTLGAATADLSQIVLKETKNWQMATITAVIFVVIALMITLFGWRIQSLFGQWNRKEKLVAKSTVGCLRLGSLGCGLWTPLSALMAFLTGTMAATREPVSITDILVGASGSLLAIILMLSVAWFISTNFVSLSAKERTRAYQAYVELLETSLPRLADPETRDYVQEQTMEVLTKLDLPLKSTLLQYLNQTGLLTGATSISLRNADFRGVDLHSISLPHADLREINLEHANLRGAILFQANLYKARLRQADLRRADLQGANLHQADLTGAELEGTKLYGANFDAKILTPGQRAQARLEKPAPRQ